MEFKVKTSKRPFYLTYKGKEIKHRGMTFHIPFKNQNAPLEIYLNGKGMNGNGKRNKESIEEAIQRFGIKKFKKIANQKPNKQSIEKWIEECEENIADEDERRKIVDVLRKKTGLSLHFEAGLLYALTGKLKIDVFSLDHELHRIGYDEDEHGSMQDYLKLKFGQEIADLIGKLI